MIDERLKKLANLAVRKGVNLQKGQMLLLHCDVECSELARMVIEEAYLCGAKRVIVKYLDDQASKLAFQYADLEALTEIPQYIIDEHKYFMDNKMARILIKSSYPGLLSEIDATKIQQVNIASQKALAFYQEFVMKNNVAWTIIAAPNKIWAKAVFPNLNEDDAVNALWDAILSASRITKDPISEWNTHINNLAYYTNKMNEYNFKKLVFQNKLGTQLEVGLIKDHIWAGGAEKTNDDILFAPNIPTEEIFTMPDKFQVNGKVVATKPLDYQGVLIEDFYLVFKDGKVIEYDAKKGKETLRCLIEFDEGSAYLGEVALISHNSPISKSNILFYNTLFDENASCHLALGRAYPMNVKNGLLISKAELIKLGSNDSLAHVDFMFGSADMMIKGIMDNQEEVIVFKDGNFII